MKMERDMVQNFVREILVYETCISYMKWQSHTWKLISHIIFHDSTYELKHFHLWNTIHKWNSMWMFCKGFDNKVNRIVFFEII